MATEQKMFSGWAYIHQAEDLPGCWVAHCFEYDIISTGDSPQHALDMVREAVGIALADDLNHGFDPAGRRAPDSEWDPLLRLFERATQVPVNRMDASDFREFAVPFRVVLTKTSLSDMEFAQSADAGAAGAYARRDAA